MNVLCVVAHPDDESFFAGGALAMHAQAGHDVVVAALSDGESSRLRGWRWFQHRRLMFQRFMQFQEACENLGAEARYIPIFRDQRSDGVPQLTINRTVEGLMERYQPGLVYTHYGCDLNLDHRRVSEAVMVATRGGPTVMCMSPEWPNRGLVPFVSNSPLSLSANAKASKLAACLCYVDEMRDYPHPRSERAIIEQSAEDFMEIR